MADEEQPLDDILSKHTFIDVMRKDPDVAKQRDVLLPDYGRGAKPGIDDYDLRERRPKNYGV